MDADQFAQIKGYRMADKITPVTGESVDVHLTGAAKEALITASAQYAIFKKDDMQEETKIEKSRNERKREELALRMPYSIPEPVKHAEDSTKENLKLKSYVPMSDFKWYKKVRIVKIDISHH